MPTVNINGTDYEFEDGLTLIQACEQVGIEIPRFCYHERLKIAGNCRMCLVEAVGAPKPVASCAMGVGDMRPGRDGSPPKVRTDSEMVKKAREGVMEFLLINHPLDCPICDQGGECDLQDQAMYYGQNYSRYDDMKRAVEDKYMGPLIKTHMTRCIQCTRCIRFMEDVAGVPELGATGRGEGMEVTTYVEQALHSEMSGNIIDLCPVGALTSKPYAFAARPWELKKIESIDVMDAVGSNIRVDVRGNAVLRVLPRLHEDINEEWISDKTRYACDGLKTQRLDRPYVRREGKLTPASWEEAFNVIAEKASGLQGSQMAAIAGDLACVESMVALKELMHNLGCNTVECRQDGAYLPSISRSDYLFNSTIAGIEQADAIVMVGVNPRCEAPLVNSRIRKRYLEGELKLFSVGESYDLTYPVEHLGSDPSVLRDMMTGKHDICDVLEQADYPMVIMGMAALTRSDSESIYHHVKQFASHYAVRDEWNGFNLLHHAAARVGGIDVGFVCDTGLSGIMDAVSSKDIRFVYLLGADEFDTSYLSDAFVVYQGHHGDKGAERADVILPGAAYTEKDATYVNMEGRVQRAARATFAPGEAKEDWQIIRALSDRLGHSLPYNSLGQMRQHMHNMYPHLSELDQVPMLSLHTTDKVTHGKIDSAPFYHTIENFYMTDPISRVSPTMAACVREIMQQTKEAA